MDFELTDDQKLLSDTVAQFAKQKSPLERLRKLVEHYIRETRQSIWDLRSPTLVTSDLVTALRDAGETLTADKNVSFDLVVRGKPFVCPPKVEEQLLRVGREALSNAVRHAQPTRVRVELNYQRDSVRLRVVDDGSGFNLDDPGFTAGTHWGLTSMRERAQQINAQFEIVTAPDIRSADQAKRSLAYEECLAHLATVLALSDEHSILGAETWLQRTEDELARVAVRRAPDELSATELGIARLAASGLTNQEIAGQVFLTRKAVEANLARAYRKLGIRSRAQLARALDARESEAGAS